MPISTRLLERGTNACIIIPAWATLNDWLEALACKPIATPLIDFGVGVRYRVGVTALNWYLMDLLGMRTAWLTQGWEARDDFWLLINPLRYRLLGHQPKRPYPLDVRDFLHEHHPQLLHCTLAEHPYFAFAPTVHKADCDDLEAERLAINAPWSRLAVLDNQEMVIGMVWGAGPRMGTLPPIMNFLNQPSGT